MAGTGPAAGRAAGIAVALGGFLALAAALGVGRFVYTPILPYMAADLGLDRSGAGLVASANFLGYLAGALAAARTPAPGGRRAWLAGALALGAAATAAMALPGAMPAFLALRFAGGAASAYAMVFASALVLDRLAALGRPGLAALLYAGVGGGIAVSALVAAAGAADGAGWRWMWLASGAVAAAALVPVWLLTGGGNGAAAPPSAPAGRSGAGRGGEAGRARRWVLAYGLFGFGYVVTATFVCDMMRADPALRPAEHAVWLCVGLAAAPSVALWLWAGRRIGLPRAFAAACLAEAVGVLLAAWGTGLAAVLLAAALLGGTFMGLTALGLVAARDLSGGDPRRALALMTASFGLGQAGGPFLAGLLGDLAGGYGPPSALAAAALVLAAALVPPGPYSPRKR